MKIILMTAILTSQDEEAKAKLREFQQRVQTAGKKDGEIETALRDLSSVRHPLILKELLRWTRMPFRPVRRQGLEEVGIKLNRVAAECIAERYPGDADAARGLLDSAKVRDAERPKRGSLDEEDLAQDLACLVEYFAKIRCRAKARDLVPFFRHRYLPVCDASLGAAESFQSKELVGPLIEVLAEAEKMKETSLDSGAGTGTLEDRKGSLLSGAQRALEATTRQKHPSSQAWKKWWGENGAKFKEIE